MNSDIHVRSILILLSKFFGDGTSLGFLSHSFFFSLKKIQNYTKSSLTPPFCFSGDFCNRYNANDDIKEPPQESEICSWFTTMAKSCCHNSTAQRGLHMVMPLSIFLYCGNIHVNALHVLVIELFVLPFLSFDACEPTLWCLFTNLTTAIDKQMGKEDNLGSEFLIYPYEHNML